MSSFFIWLMHRAPAIHATLNPGTVLASPNWPQQLRRLYSEHNGQVAHAPFLFPEKGNWLPVGEAQRLGAEWRRFSAQTGTLAQVQNLLPIFALPSKDHQAVAIHILSGKILEVNIDNGMQAPLFDHLDDLFFYLKKEWQLKIGTTYPKTPVSFSDEALLLAQARNVESEFLNKYGRYVTPDLQLTIGKALFSEFGETLPEQQNPFALELAVRYFEEASSYGLTRHQRHEVAALILCCHQMIADWIRDRK